MAHTPGHESKADREEREEKEARESRREEKAEARMHAKSGFVDYGYNPTIADDILRRANRKPMGGDNKPTVTVEGNVVTVTMPNKAQYRLTMVEKVIPATIKADDVKTWEYQAPPVEAKDAK